MPTSTRAVLFPYTTLFRSNVLDLVLTQPGVVSGANTGGGVHVNGARDRSWNYTLDGIDNNESSAGGSDFAPLRTNPDSSAARSEEHTSELQSLTNLVCRLL